MAVVTGIKVLIAGINDALDMKKAEAEAVAIDIAGKALRIFRRHQSPAPKIDDGRKNVADSAAKRKRAIEFAEANQGRDEKTTIGTPWINRSSRAARSVSADAGRDSESVYFNMFHTMSYGVYLELANNREHAVIEPIVRSLAPEFLEKVKRIYAP